MVPEAAKFGLDPVLSPDGSARTLRRVLKIALDGDHGLADAA